MKRQYPQRNQRNLLHQEPQADMLLKPQQQHQQLRRRRTHMPPKHRLHQLMMALDETWHTNSNSSHLDRQWQAQRKVS
jgi:hypothetical protein